MNFNLRKAKSEETNIAFDLLKLAAKTLAKKNVEQWQYWNNPPVEKIKWIEEGFSKGEFFIIENDGEEIMGMVRILEKDLFYWGERNDKALYVHSLVIHQDFSGNKLGNRVLKKIENDAKENKFDLLRLDCDSTNTKLCEYYTKQGFLIVGNKKLPFSTNNLFQKKI